MIDDTHSPSAVAAEWVRRFNAHDVERLVDLYADDGRHTSPRIQQLHPDTGGELVGRVALVTWWRDALSRSPDLRYEVVAIVADDDRAYVEYIRHCPGETDTTVAERFVVRDGRIVSSRVFLG
jgi:ketosteroid isomerase-like protein